jgi:GNAT superfamily N-acetyltransferase
MAAEADVPALAALRRQLSVDQVGRVDDPDFEQQFREWYEAESSRRVTWLAELDGDPVGMVSLAVFERMPRPGRPTGRWGYLGNAYVRADHRDRGIGTALITALLDYADAHRLERVVLSPSPRSVPLYRRMGFGPADMLLARRLPDGSGSGRHIGW